MFPLLCRGKVNMKSLCLISKKAELLQGLSLWIFEEADQDSGWVIHGLEPVRNILGHSKVLQQRMLLLVFDLLLSTGRSIFTPASPSPINSTLLQKIIRMDSTQSKREIKLLKQRSLILMKNQGWLSQLSAHSFVTSPPSITKN